MQTARRSSPRSSTRRCTRKRCSTCGTGCRTSTSTGRSTSPTSSAALRRRVSASCRDLPAGGGDARRATRAAASRSAGTTSSARSRRRCRPSTSTSHNVTNAEFLEFVAAAVISGASCGRTTRLGVASQAERVSASDVLGRRQRRRSGAGTACSRNSAAARPGRSTSARRRPTRSRAGRDAGCRPRPSIHRAAFGTPRGRRAAVPVGRCAAATPRAATSISQRGSRCRPARVRPARARGACTISSATAGSGRRRCSAPFPGFSPMASYPEYSAEFFDGQHFVMKGASPATAQGADPAAASATGSAPIIRTSTRSSAPCAAV